MIVGVLAPLGIPLFAVLTNAWFGFSLIPTDLEPWIRGSLFPFLYGEKVIAPADQTKTTPVSNFPFLCTFVQWSVMSAASALLVKRGHIRQPALAASLVIGLAGGMGALCVWAAGLRVANLHL